MGEAEFKQSVGRFNETYDVSVGPEEDCGCSTRKVGKGEGGQEPADSGEKGGVTVSLRDFRAR
jgi:hypothetical protein